MFSPTGTVEVLASDPTRLGREQLREAIGSCEDLRSWVTGREARFIRALDALPDDPAHDTAGEVARDQNVGPGQARRRTDNAEQFHELPATQDALEQAAITSAHADAMARARAKADPKARAALGANEARLLALGAGETAHEFAKRLERFVALHSGDDGRSEWERKKARRRLSIYSDKDGMTQIHGVFDPENGRVVKSLVDRIADELFRRDHRDHPTDAVIPLEERSNEHRQADALVEACRRADGKDHPGSVPDRVVVILQYEDLLDRLAAAGHTITLPDGTPIPAAIARRMACDGGLIPLVLGGDSIPLDLGRTKRRSSPAQRTALKALWATCSFADCRAPFDWCEIHHTRPFNADGAHGRTDIDELTPNCRRCHDLAHTVGWTQVKHPDGTVTTTAPDGRTWHRRPDRRVEPPPAAAPDPEPQPASAAALFTDVA